MILFQYQYKEPTARPHDVCRGSSGDSGGDWAMRNGAKGDVAEWLDNKICCV